MLTNLNTISTGLRAIEPEDLAFLYTIENNTDFWEVSHTLKPFSKYLLKQYIENAHLDIFEAKQVRFVIEDVATKTPVGLIDLFDYNPQHNRAGIGIVISKKHQQKGHAKEALTLLINYAFTVLNLHQLYANITANNTKSLELFKTHGFLQIGVKKDWLCISGSYKDEILFQLIKA